MKIGVFNPTFNVYGGGEFVTAVIANSLAQKGHDVVLFTNAQINGINVKKFFGKSLHPLITNIIHSSFIKPKGLLDFYQNLLRSYILKLKTDILIDVYSCCLFPWTDISYIHFPFINNFNYFREFPYIKYPHLLQIGAFPYVLFQKKLFNPNDKLVIANSNYTASEIMKNSANYSTVLYPPVSSVFFNDNQSDLTAKHKENLVVTVSRFDPDKGLEKIPYIASLTRKNVHFAIIGRLYNKKTFLSLQNLTKKLGVNDRIHFFPDVSRSKMKEILQRSKIYLHTKIGEHFGISIVEGMAMGCIPITHDSGGNTEFVPKDLRYQTIYEAAEIISNQIVNWSSQKVIENQKVAEQFREEKFSNDFLRLFEQYVERYF
ncbi:MAG: glycosyltransferase [Candidatus Bathyarchaeota archaeon]|nr:MAG: glycosyltransferase [Candidatus Bathyarchaeota archaeon]